jgi:hypothetical protein
MIHLYGQIKQIEPIVFVSAIGKGPKNRQKRNHLHISTGSLQRIYMQSSFPMFLLVLPLFDSDCNRFCPARTFLQCGSALPFPFVFSFENKVSLSLSLLACPAEEVLSVYPFLLAISGLLWWHKSGQSAPIQGNARVVSGNFPPAFSGLCPRCMHPS